MEATFPPCKFCGTTLTRFHMYKRQSFCTFQCAMDYRRAQSPRIRCVRCGIEFRTTAYRAASARYCSRACMRPCEADPERLRRWYVDEGLTSTEIAELVGVAPASVRKALRALGISRSLSQAMRLRWQNVTDEQRAAMLDPPHAACRGRVVPYEERLSDAKARYALQVGIGPHEVTFAGMLRDRGVPFVQQLPCGPYNLDFAIAEHGVAVEVVAGGGNPRARANAAERTEHVLDSWHLFVVKFQTPVPRVITEGVVDELVAFCEEVSGDPARPGQQRVVRTDGQRVKPRRRRNRDREHGSVVAGAH